MIRVNGLFLDYESVIDPLHLSKKQSKFPSHLETLLNKIGRNIPIGVITTRDLPFIIAQTKFAHAWSAIGGLEIKIGNQLFISHGAGDVLPFLNQSLRYARKYIRDGIVIEEKHNYSGQTVAFTINWQTAKDEKAASASYSRIVAYCKSLPLNVIEYPGNSFVDVFPHPIDKGKTLKELKDDLGLAGGILYISGSDIDNTAFREADISVGVSNGEPFNLDCEYWIVFNDVVSFLSSLFKQQMIFSADLLGIRASGSTVPG